MCNVIPLSYRAVTWEWIIIPVRIKDVNHDRGKRETGKKSGISMPIFTIDPSEKSQSNESIGVEVLQTLITRLLQLTVVISPGEYR